MDRNAAVQSAYGPAVAIRLTQWQPQPPPQQLPPPPEDDGEDLAEFPLLAPLEVANTES